MHVPGMLTWFLFFFSSRRRHTRCSRDWSSDVCSSDLEAGEPENVAVLEALADLALQNKSREGLEGGIRYLDLARNRGSTNPADFELLGRLFVARGDRKSVV